MKVDPRLCVACRGGKYLCGLSYCPIVVKHLTSEKLIDLGERVRGSSPPSIFVGRYGYPKVGVYASAPPEVGDTSVYEDPSKWIQMDLNDFLAMRLSMVRGGRPFKVTEASNPPRLLDDVQVLTLSPRPVELEMEFQGRPRGKVSLDESYPPMGPAAPVNVVRLGTLPPPERVVERVYQDRDLKAQRAITKLYDSGIAMERIARLMSAGTLGVKRRLVPTRWSITAVDKAIGDALVQEVKGFEEVDKVELYVRVFRKNLFVGLLVPGKWAFEWGEAWFPHTTWNYWGDAAVIEIDYEGYRRRKTYPEIGGCYYSSRLAAAEFLRSRRRQAVVILWREIYPGFDLPVGVWFVRENVRELFRGKPAEFDSLDQALASVSRLTKAKGWEGKSWAVRLMRSRLFP